MWGGCAIALVGVLLGVSGAGGGCAHQQGLQELLCAGWLVGEGHHDVAQRCSQQLLLLLLPPRCCATVRTAPALATPPLLLT